ncbi:MAG: hypothetical protein KAS51_07600 [Candidatus Omnitrophica bacterium]|nr:hypothetical protein [Candidatus Omnitrophota bacterium]
MKKTISLVELIIAITLMGVIVMGAMSIYYLGQKILTSADNKMTVLNEFTYVIEMINKDVLLASGDRTNQGLTLVTSAGNDGLSIRQDISLATGLSNQTPDDYSDDRTVIYWFEGPPNRRIISTISGVTSNHLVNLHGTEPLCLVFRDGGVEIKNLAIRLDPSKPFDPQDNPQVTSVDLNNNSTLFFASACHSW